MSKRGDEELLRDIQEAIKRILDYTKNSGYQKFTHDIKTQDAVIRNLEIIGEASKNISKSLTSQHAQMAWNDLARVRDKLIHHYFGVNLDIVWNIIEESLPEIAVQIEGILADKNK